MITPRALYEGHHDQPRGAEELQFAVEHHSRASVPTRLVMRDSFHCGEISLLFGLHGREALDPWTLAPP